MKKTLISLMIVALLLCSLGSLAYADDAKDLPAAPVAEEFVPGTVPAQSLAVESIVPPVNAMVLSILEQGLEYDSNDEVFLWNSLYYMISMYGQMDDRAELTDDTLTLPSETVSDYAAAMFANYAGLPQLPEQMRDRVSYDPDTDCYTLARGDAGLSEVVILSAQEKGEVVEVTGVLIALEDGSQLCRFNAALRENNTMFGYSISGMNIS